MYKRGQVTVFIIVGILLLILLGTFFLLVSTLTTFKLKNAPVSPLPIDTVNTIFEECLSNTAEEGVAVLSMQGGYYSLPPTYRVSDLYFIPYYFYQGSAQFPSQEVLEKQLALFIQDALPQCLDFTQLEQQGFSIEVSSDFIDHPDQKEIAIYNSDSITHLFRPEVSTTSLSDENSINLPINVIILDDTLVLDAAYKVVIKKGNTARELTHFTQKLPSDLGKMHALAERIMVHQSESYPNLPLSLISEEIVEEEAYFSTVTLGEDILYSLYFTLPEERPNLKSIQFNFLIGYNWSAQLVQSSEEVSQTPEFQDESQYSAPLFSQLIFPIFIPSVVAEESDTIPSDSNIPSTNENWKNPGYVQSLSSENLLASISQDPALMDNDLVFSEFEFRLGTTSFIENVNADRSILNEWAKRKGISFGNDGRLAEYQLDKIVTKGDSSSIFSPRDVPGALVLESGALQLPNGVIISNAKIEQRNAKLVVREGSLDLRDSLSVDTIIVEKSQILAGRYFIRPLSDTLSVSVDKQKTPALVGEATLSENDVLAFSFKGTIRIDEKSLDIGSGSALTEMRNGNPSVEYTNHGTTFSRYVSLPQICSYKEGCIERNLQNGKLTITARETSLSIKAYDDSLKSVKVHQLAKTGKVQFTDRNGVSAYFNQGPMQLKGNPSQLSVAIESAYTSKGQSRTLKLIPGDQGTRVLDCRQKCQNMGILTDRNLLFMNAMRESRSTEKEDSKNVAARYGSPGQKIRGYLDEPRELRVVNAFIRAADQNGLDPYFLMAAAFGEGLATPGGFFARYYEDPNAKVDSYGDLGADRFGKEIGTLQKQGYLRRDFGNKDYIFFGEETNERGEKVKFVEFRNIEVATEAMAAMVHQRQDFVKRDLQANGINPNDLTPNELHYWTYVYYNAGSGPPEDPRGVGRGIVVNRARQGRERLRIPTQPQPEYIDGITEGSPTRANPHANAQRIIATTALLREPSDTSLPLAARKVAVREIAFSKSGEGS